MGLLFILVTMTTMIATLTPLSRPAFRMLSVLGLGLVLSGAFGSQAFSAEEKNKQQLIFDDEAPVAVQMASMLLPVSLREGHSQKTTTTVILIGKSVEALSYICRRTPKVREALFVTFGKKPIPVGKDKSVDNTKVGPQARAAINRKLGKKAVVRAYVMLGSRRISQGVAARLPGSSVGCQRIGTLPEEVAKTEALEAKWEERRLKREERREQRGSTRGYKYLPPPKQSQ